MPYFGLLPHPFPAFPPYVVRTPHIRGMRTTDVTKFRDVVPKSLLRLRLRLRLKLPLRLRLRLRQRLRLWLG